MKSWILATGAALCAFASPAAACTLSDWNVYEEMLRPSIVDLVDTAATIDWVRVDVSGRPDCAREPDDAVLGFDHAEVAWGAIEGCIGPDRENQTEFTALVEEHLKGRSDRTFPLIMRHPAGYSEVNDYHYPERWQRFSDVSLLSLSDEIRIRFYLQGVASGGHRGMGFWDNPASFYIHDGTDSCGGQPTFHPALPYIVFRDAKGGVMAMEPAFADDELLARLRARREDPAFDIRRTLPVEDFLASLQGLIMARIDECTAPDVRGFSQGAQVTVLRGDPGFVFEGQFSYEGDSGVEHDATSASDLAVDPEVPPEEVEANDARNAAGEAYNAAVEAAGDAGPYYQYGPPGSTTFAFNDLPDFYELKGEACPVGATILIYRTRFPVTGSMDSGWFDRTYPGWLDTLQPEYRAMYLEPEPAYAVGSVLMPVLISPEGQVHLADIPTGLNLTGPRTFSVDQAFRWFEAGSQQAP